MHGAIGHPVELVAGHLEHRDATVGGDAGTPRAAGRHARSARRRTTWSPGCWPASPRGRSCARRPTRRWRLVDLATPTCRGADRFCRADFGELVRLVSLALGRLRRRPLPSSALRRRPPEPAVGLPPWRLRIAPCRLLLPGISASPSSAGLAGCPRPRHRPPSAGRGSRLRRRSPCAPGPPAAARAMRPPARRSRHPVRLRRACAATQPRRAGRGRRSRASRRTAARLARSAVGVAVGEQHVAIADHACA